MLATLAIYTLAVVIENSRVRVTVDYLGAVSVAGNYEGSGTFGADAVVRMTTRVSSATGYDALVLCETPRVVANNSEVQTIELLQAIDCTSKGGVSEVLTLSVRTDSNIVEFSSLGKGSGSVYRSIPFAGDSVYNVFGKGVVQMMQTTLVRRKNKYATYDSVRNAYALGAVKNGAATAGKNCGAITRLSTTSPDGGKHLKVVTAELGNVVFAEYLTRCSLTQQYHYTENTWDTATSKTFNKGCAPSDTVQQWNSSFAISANNHDFPIFEDGKGIVSADAEDSKKDYIAFMTGVYGSPVGTLCTHPNQIQNGVTVGQMATSVATPERGYPDGFNFFDPDNYIALSAILYAADATLMGEVRKVLDRSADLISETGQIPHHLIYLEPTYEAISGAVQTGPNVFWILSLLAYVAATQNVTYLEASMPTLQSAERFLSKQIHENGETPRGGEFQALMSAPGPLMIDVFKRGNYTADSNAMLVIMYSELAKAYELVADEDNANRCATLSRKISRSMRQVLWEEDHFVTQVNPDGTIRDFVDYDANLIAVAAGVADADDRFAKVLGRIDEGGQCPSSPTFVSERWYGPDDCWMENTGDSWCGMGRIAWYDALARRRVASLNPNSELAEAALSRFNNVLHVPIRDTVLEDVWMRERYGCDGTQQLNRTKYYFEYPSIQAMLTHRVKYGIELGLTTHTIAPFGKTDFVYNVGSIFVKYSQQLVVLRLPGKGVFAYVIEGMLPSEKYTLTHEGCDAVDVTIKVAASGTASFTATISDDNGAVCTVNLKHDSE